MRSPRTWWLVLGFALTAVGLSSVVSGQDTVTPTGQRLLAVTVDDLPGFTRLASGDSRTAANRRLLSAFKDRGIHATGFVVCANAARNDEVLQAWVDSGMELGNHTAHHLDLHRTRPEQWAADVEECHNRLSQIGGVKARYFRFPGLHQGETGEQRSVSISVLERLGYTIAHVTLDNSEWLLADAYGQALLVNDVQKRDRIARDYVDHILSAVRHFDNVAQTEFGRHPPHVLLLHANALAADHAGALLDALRANGFRIVPLAEVLADPVFALKDTYSGPKGLSWFYRTRSDAFERLGSWDDSEALRITNSFLR